ncbi:hypothetical protein CISIN_1g035265mg [Citrus sinensis]|uniref:Uncharacterized protein n=1 Tax=Citrus sinensis TaxID=2711 RepID=A0A067DTM8_CITSI|nr:hypothetical protein CISIN_1g035265mg [Citrus sinensis]
MRFAKTTHDTHPPSTYPENTRSSYRKTHFYVGKKLQPLATRENYAFPNCPSLDNSRIINRHTILTIIQG